MAEEHEDLIEAAKEYFGQSSFNRQAPDATEKLLLSSIACSLMAIAYYQKEQAGL